MMFLHAVYKNSACLAAIYPGLAVLFAMPIAFMLIMSVALSKDAEPHAGAQIALAGAAANPVNAAFAHQLGTHDIKVQAALADTGRLKTLLQQGGLDMLVVNPNAEAAALADDVPLQLWIKPDTERSWLSAMRGILQQSYTQTRINMLADHNESRADAARRPASAPAAAKHQRGIAANLQRYRRLSQPGPI